MNKKNLLNDAKMDTQTIFHASGEIEINPASYELGRNDVATEKKVKYRANVEVQEDGTTKITLPGNKGKGSRYKTLYATDHAIVKVTQGGVTKRRRLIIQFRFPNSCNQGEINMLYGKENTMILEFFKKTNTAKIWN